MIFMNRSQRVARVISLGEVRRAKKAERNRDIYQLREAGLTYRAIGEMYGICVETVRQICVRERRLLRKEQEAKENSESEEG